MRILFIPYPKYLANPIFSAIASEMNNDVPLYLETNERYSEKDAEIKAPDCFYQTISINRALMLEVLENIRERKLFKLRRSIKDLRFDINFKLKAAKIDAIVISSDMGGLVTRLCNEWAVKNNIPTIIMQPSFVEGVPKTLVKTIKRRIKYIALNKVLNIPLVSKQHWYGNERETNHLFLWGKDFRNTIHNNKIKSHLVGNPTYDEYTNIVIDKYINKPCVLICTQPFNGLVKNGSLRVGDDEKLNDIIFETVTDNENIFFIIKVHPSEDGGVYLKLFGGRFGVNYMITRDISFYELIKVADVHVSILSDTSFTAVARGVPIILFGTDIVNHMHNDQFNNRVELRANNSDETTVAINKCLQPKGRTEFADRRLKYMNEKLYCFGHSAKQTIETIRWIVQCKE